MFRDHRKKYYIIKTDSCSSRAEELPLFIQQAPANSIIYVIANVGLFLFDSVAQSCKKIATDNALKNKAENSPALQDIITTVSLNEGQLYPIDIEKVSVIEKLTTVGNVYRGLPIDLRGFEQMYELAKALISHEDELLIAKLTALGNFRENEDIISLFESQSILGSEVLEPNQGFIDLVRMNISHKTPHQIALYFQSYCENHFNDSVLGEKWEAFVDRIVRMVGPSSPAKEERGPASAIR
ncbi:MAG: hypothetical protein K0S27_711 [Gammaproteobacteria bacterium]|jgi:hypothetical protein|nr:hypothetical protein [Gammaproteobacteria bacterium]